MLKKVELKDIVYFGNVMHSMILWALEKDG